MHKPTRVALTGAAIAALLTLPGLGNGTLWDNSETAYGEVAREILLFHDAVVMHLNGEPWFVQPPLYFWIAALFAKLLGVGTLAFRLPAALATIAMAAMTGYAIARNAGERAGLFGTVVLSTSLMQAIVGRLAIMDALLDLAVAMTIFWWYRALQTGRGRYFYFGTIAAALGFLAKGPVAPVIALLVIVPYYVWERRAQPLILPNARAWFASAALFAAIVLPWLCAVAARGGVESVVQLIGHYTFGRYTGTIENQAGPLWYYVPVLILGFFPWVAFLPAAIIYGINQLNGRAADDGHRSQIRLALVWIIVPFVFFSLAKTKLPNYIALELPGLALLVALYFDSIVLRYRRRSLMISAAAIPVTIGLLAVAIRIFSHNNKLTADVTQLQGDLIAVGALMLLGSLVTAVLFAIERTARYGPHALGAGTFAGIFVLGVVALPHAERFKPIPRLAAEIQAQRRDGDLVATQGVPGENALIFYTLPHVHAISSPDDVHPVGLETPRSVICSRARVFLVTHKIDPQHDPWYGRHHALVATDENDALYLFDGPRCAAANQAAP